MNKTLTLYFLIMFAAAQTVVFADIEIARAAFESAEPGEAVVSVKISASGYSWKDGPWENPLVLRMDGEKISNLIPFRGKENAEYRMMLGPVAAGSHEVILADPAVGEKRVEVESMVASVITENSKQYRIIKYAPFLLGREDNESTDTPLMAWVEESENGNGLTTLEYSAVWSNEDGGTLTAELMARYGRTVDIEFIYRITINTAGEVVAEKFQGKSHNVADFKGVKKGSHPVLRTCTMNNMVCDDGESDFTFTLAPEIFTGPGTRERMLDIHSWVNRVMFEELEKENKIVKKVPDPFRARIADPRMYALVDLETEMLGSNLKLEVAILMSGSDEWRTADMGDGNMMLGRSGWARVGVWLPHGSKPGDIQQVRLRAVGKGGFINVRHVGPVTMLGGNFMPRKISVRWSGTNTLVSGGNPVIIDVEK